MGQPPQPCMLAEMPPEFRCPAAATHGTGETGYVVIVGPETDAYNINTPFTPTHGADIRHITDGTSNTILVLETDRSIPWTMPDNAHWTEGGAAPHWPAPTPPRAHALFADGSTRFIKATVSPQTLMMLLTMNGGEVIGGG